MGVELYFSNQLMPLADKLFENLLLPNDSGNIFQAPVVIVPNMNLAKWIKLTLARESAVFMNVAFRYLEDGLWRMLRSLDDRSVAEPERLSGDGLKILLLTILLAAEHQVTAMAGMGHYFQGPDGRRRDDYANRCVQFAAVMADLFQEYAYHRSDMLRRWREDSAVDDAMEAGQQWLFRRMLDLKNRMTAGGGPAMYTMDEYARWIFANRTKGSDIGDSLLERVHFFGLSQLSPFHVTLLARLSDCFDLRIYSLNPSREYWEDIRTPAEKKWIERKTAQHLKISDDERDAGDLFAVVDHPLLSAWGKPGRESIRLLCQLTGYDFHAGFADPPRPDTLLGAIAQGLLTLEVEEENASPLSQDRSLQIVACPGIRREVETVYHSILSSLANDPGLMMTDIAVMVTDMARYKPVIDSVFGRKPTRIAYNLVDARARTESRFAQAVLAVMHLAQGPFSRKAVFDLLRNPCVMQRWAYGPEALAVWIGWADALGIFHDWENPAAAGADGHPAGSFSWRQGLERLRFSRILSNTRSASNTETAPFHDIVPFSDIDTGDQRLIEKFSLIVEGLHTSLTALKRISSGVRAWRDAFFQVVEQFIEISPAMRGEESVFQSLAEALERLVAFDARMPADVTIPMNSEMMWAFVRSHLDGVTGGQGDYLTGGVTISALMPMRPIPFKVVYVLGLEEGRFPGRLPESRLDLRTRARRIGDTTLAERNRYLFLEILISVRQKLYLSYVCRDLQKDREQAPCSLIQELRRYVEQHLMSGAPFEIARIPVNADSPLYLTPEMQSRWSDVMVNDNVAQRISAYRRYGLWTAFEKQATPTELAQADRFRPDFSPPAMPAPASSSSSIPLTIDQLRRFLLDPVSTAGRYHLGIGEWIDPTAELAEREDEPIASRFPTDYRIRSAALNDWLAVQFGQRGNQAPLKAMERIFETIYADFARRSLVPTGAFALRDKSALKKQLRVMGEHLLPFIEQIHGAQKRFAMIRVGDALDDAIDPLAGESLDVEATPIVLPESVGLCGGRTAEISGSVPWVWLSGDGEWHCLVATPSTRTSRVADKYVLAPLLLMMTLAGGPARVPCGNVNRVNVHVVYREHVLNLGYDLTPERARSYLQGLAGAFMTPRPLIWLPFEAVGGHRDLRAYIENACVTDLDREGFRQAMEELREGQADPVDELLGPVVTPDILDRARERFRAILRAD